ncbi:hypothetical protein ASF06_09245 [Agreia sp. Leaf244]|uniref:hypothetical protein n=1 Tax=Agreia sp. Leaf244 TaxID=1736305 RepID=UPI0006F47875|nr:hypothetical protein [Agreia sp. Leaf244]KQO10343.1 hypothetical protein ASF06_09245 [Agreia sp. Leaf244]
MRLKKPGTIALAAVIVALALCGCSSEPEASNTPSPSRSSEPTTPPAATATPTPKFTGAIDYDRLTGDAWTTLSALDRYAACNEFFAALIPGEAAMTQNSLAPEVQSWFAKRLDVVQALVLDKSNDLNFEAAKNIVDCLTKIDNVSQEESDGHKGLLSEIVGLHQSSIEGNHLVYIDPAQITRYSDGNYDATSTTSLPYKALSVEGYANNGFGDMKGQLLMTYYEWTYEEAAYRYVLTSPAYDTTVPLYFGDKPPIVVDPSRQNARADQN